MQGWISTMLDYTVVGGKLNRGVLVGLLRESIDGGEGDAARRLQGHAVGWSVELVQAAFLVADDMMDDSVTRRGAPCWYLRPEVGAIAINDAFILLSAANRLVHTHFADAACLPRLLGLFNEVRGQGLAALMFGWG